jgi:hypothetical protein
VRYVLVESEVDPRLVGGRAVVGDFTDPANAGAEADKGLRIRLAPQGITGTNYLEMDYADPAPMTLPITWAPANVYIPSAPSTVTQFVGAMQQIMDRLNDLDIERTLTNLNRLMVAVEGKITVLDVEGMQTNLARTLGKLDATLDGLQTQKLMDEAAGLLADLRKSNAELQGVLANPVWRTLPEDAGVAAAKLRELVSDPKLAGTVSHMERSMARLDRILGGGEADLAATIDSLRRITDNLRDLTEDAKRYPSNLLFGRPPQPLER